MFYAVTKHINEVCLLPNSFVNLIFIWNFYDDERGENCTKYLKNCKCYSPSQRHVMIEWKDRKIFGQWRKRENEKGKEEIFGEGTYFVSRQDAEPHPPVSPQCCSPCCSHCPLTFQGKFYLSFSPQKPLLRNYFVIALQELHSYTL